MQNWRMAYEFHPGNEVIFPLSSRGGIIYWIAGISPINILAMEKNGNIFHSHPLPFFLYLGKMSHAFGFW